MPLQPIKSREKIMNQENKQVYSDQINLMLRTECNYTKLNSNELHSITNAIIRMAHEWDDLAGTYQDKIDAATRRNAVLAKKLAYAEARIKELEGK